MQRWPEYLIRKDLKSKLVLLSGPRQVGKTTLSKQVGLKFDYLNFDSASDRKIIEQRTWNRDSELLILDEIHKMKKWKAWIKGIYDTEGIPPSYLLTGSARLDTYRKGGDSLAGRHFNYRLNPITLREAGSLLDSQLAWERLVSIGGFPEPFLKNDHGFAKRWRRQHLDTILREDLIDLEKVRDIKSIEFLVELLKERVGSTVSNSSLAEDLQVSPITIKHWLQILENLFVIFPVRPFSKRISRSLLKEPKYYFYDTGAVEGDKGMKLENAAAVLLLAELQKLEDTSGSRVDLHYLRDKEKREVDFCVVIDKKPVVLVETKWSDESFSPHLFHFRKFLGDIPTVQAVQSASRTQTKGKVQMLPAHEFFGNLNFEKFGAP